MKKILFIIIALSTLSTAIYASFPVSENNIVAVSSEDQTTEPPAPASNVDWGLAAICYFFGILGVHRFVMGDTKNGILMLLTLGGCGIWALIDFIRILSGDMYR